MVHVPFTNKFLLKFLFPHALISYRIPVHARVSVLLPDRSIWAYVYLASVLPARAASRNKGAQNSIDSSPTKAKMNFQLKAYQLGIIHV